MPAGMVCGEVTGKYWIRIALSEAETASMIMS